MISFCCSCTEDSVTNPAVITGDAGFSLFEYSHIGGIDPNPFIASEPLHFNFVYNCRYEGKGSIQINGRGGGSPVGDLLEPVSEELGNVYFELPIYSGENSIEFTLIPTTAHNGLGLEVSIRCDSLMVDGEMVFWVSSEGYNHFVDDIPANNAFLHNISYDIVTLDRAEDK